LIENKISSKEFLEGVSKRGKKIVVINHAVNYLTIDICNAFNKKYDRVALITGSIHEQERSLDDDIDLSWINIFERTPVKKKLWSYIKATVSIYYLLMTRYRSYEVFCISLPPFAYLLKIFSYHKFSMLIWDVYPDMLKINGMSEDHLIYKTWAILNRAAFKKAYKVYTIGEKISELLLAYVPEEKLRIIYLWSVFDENKQIEKNENIFIQEHNLQKKFIVQYSGNIGRTHNVEAMLQLAEIMNGTDDIVFQFIGKGERVNSLKKSIQEKNLDNCQFLPFQTDEMFPYSLSAADVGVVILEKATSRGSVPSKTYNLMSFGIPALYIAEKESELYDYCIKYKHGKCFSSNELDEAAEFLKNLLDDKEMYQEYSRNSEIAAKDFKRNNADELVKIHLNLKSYINA